MYSSESISANLIAGFEAIALRELAARAALMERADNKYIVGRSTLEALLSRLRDDFTVLEIDGRRRFTYETCYFDGSRRESYFDHLRGRRKRSKVRIRHYLDTNLCFLEIKLKDKRGGTIKKRVPYNMEKFGELDHEALNYIDRTYLEAYRRPFPLQLQRTLDVRYQRMCLVSKTGAERVTIDGGISFSTDSDSRRVSDDTFVIEVKSAKGNGTADKILRRVYQHPTQNCSKYCVGMSIMNAGLKRNLFQPALRKLVLEQTC